MSILNIRYTLHESCYCSEMTIGDRVKRLRILHGFTQAKVAKSIGITTPSLSAIENSLTKSPKPENVMKIAGFFNVSMQWLITGQGTKEAASVQSNTSDSFETSPEERALILKYRQLQDSQRTATQTMLDAMDQSKEVKKAG